MDVLKANTAQYEALNGFTNENSHISFIQDADGNNIIGKEVLTDDKFLEIREELEQLEVIIYKRKETEL